MGFINLVVREINCKIVRATDLSLRRKEGEIGKRLGNMVDRGGHSPEGLEGNETLSRLAAACGRQFRVTLAFRAASTI